MITYQEFIFLASLNVWPKLGLPDDYIVGFAVDTTQGDPRGDVTTEEMQKEYDHALAVGWAEFRPASDNSKRTFVYPTVEGVKVFQSNLEYWMNKVKR